MIERQTSSLLLELSRVSDLLVGRVLANTSCEVPVDEGTDSFVCSPGHATKTVSQYLATASNNN